MGVQSRMKCLGSCPNISLVLSYSRVGLVSHSPRLRSSLMLLHELLVLGCFESTQSTQQGANHLCVHENVSCRGLAVRRASKGWLHGDLSSWGTPCCGPQGRLME